MIELDVGRLLFLVLWGGGTLLAYGVVLCKRLRSWRRHRDRRAWRDLLAGFALFLAGLASFVSILVLLFGAGFMGMRGFFAALSLGAFLAAGIVMAGEDEEKAEVEP